MKDYNHAWQQLAAVCRHHPDERETAAPYGFSTRVAALALSREQPRTAWFQMLSVRAMGIAGLLALLAVAVNYSSISRLFDDDAPPTDDPVAAMVAIAS